MQHVSVTDMPNYIEVYVFNAIKQEVMVHYRITYLYVQHMFEKNHFLQL